ncbi:MAG: ribonuclease III [Thermovirgaceae bacterium]|nr:ribonuclease III [Synergistales bacterium]HPC76079.1 ribonuclease III [Synergistales bacterium]HRS48755.1 ribonuclease III [Thermovirgaceae bacterium]HRU90960.1 ribonuclease III [Thermovirgaceae bacterium]
MEHTSPGYNAAEEEHRLKALEERLDYHFRDELLLMEALTHASFSNENGLEYCNERLEFLGDAVLGLCVSERLFKRYPEASEGELSARKASLVCEDSLSEWAVKVGIPGSLRLGRGLCKSGGRQQLSLSADAVEAVFGAVLIDGGYEAAESVIGKYFQDSEGFEKGVPRNPKADLQELMEKRGLGKPEYLLTGQAGPPHAPVFRVIVKQLGDAPGAGEGRTIREAERKAAEIGLQFLLHK